MKLHGTLSEKQNDYPQLLKCGRLQTFLSQPKRYLAVLFLLQLGMVIYFAVTIKVAHIILIICTFVCYFSATALNLAFPFVDPGIIPKPSLENEGEEIPINRAEIVSSRSQGVFPNREYTFPMKTHELSVKYCGNCSIYRPPRTIHCYSCGGCIEKLDHHCPWLGTCIGKRNYSLYIFYIVFMQILTALLCVQTVIYTIASPFAENEIGFILNFLILILSTLAAIFLLTLIAIHFKLSRENLTTNEFYHNKWQTRSGNPFQKNLFAKNWMKIFQHSYYPKQYFQVEMMSNLPEKGSHQQPLKLKTFQQQKIDAQKERTLYNSGFDVIQTQNGLEFAASSSETTQK